MANSLLNFLTIVQLVGAGEAVDSQSDITHLYTYHIKPQLQLVSKEIIHHAFNC